MALLFTVILGLAALFLGFALREFGRQEFLRETAAAIDAEIAVLRTLQRESAGAVPEYVRKRSEAPQPDVRFRYENADGRWLAGSIDPPPDEVTLLREGILRFSVADGRGEQIMAAKILTLPDGARVMVARDIHVLLASYGRLQWFSLLIVLFMLVVVLVSFGISAFVVTRINRIAQTAQGIISTGDLSRRISIETRWDDLSHLAQILNSFLVQVETLMVRNREITSNIAHDLRTPLARLRAGIEALDERRVTARDIDALLAEADQVLSIFQALLRITNIESGQWRKSFAPVALSDVLADAAAYYEPVAAEKEIAFEAQIAPGLEITGDADLLFQLFVNLLDNAIKFSPPRSAVTIRAEKRGELCHLRIADQGPGVPPSEHEAVFRHFWRGDSARSATGHGLGLSLVKAIADRHNGRISLHDAGPGLEVRLSFNLSKW